MQAFQTVEMNCDLSCKLLHCHVQANYELNKMAAVWEKNGEFLSNLNKLCISMALPTNREQLEDVLLHHCVHIKNESTVRQILQVKMDVTWQCHNVAHFLRFPQSSTSTMYSWAPRRSRAVVTQMITPAMTKMETPTRRWRDNWHWALMCCPTHCHPPKANPWMRIWRRRRITREARIVNVTT